MSPILSGSLLSPLVQALGYFLNIFTRKFSLKFGRKKNPETMDAVNVIRAAP